MNKAAFKDITSIIIRLTVTCLLAGSIMGITFVLTHDAKERNEQLREDRVMYSILGYDGKKNPVPQTMALHTVYRYVLSNLKDNSQSIGYAIPVSGDKYSFVELDLSGNFVRQMPLEGDAKKLRNDGERNSAVQTVTGADVESRYADHFIVVTDSGVRKAFILDGKYPGFKTFIRVKMALAADYSMLGFEVLEHEEDPGLGAEIEQKWFRGQFEGKSFEQLKSANVVRTPMPDDFKAAVVVDKNSPDYAKALETRKAHASDDIYALTGATISSRSVLNGNQAMVKKFVYRMEALDKALKSQNIKTDF
ncbi:MAG: FMN-binding protein [Proteobacteria bacterium]|nr:FMN-binding protein [Pseudomonadota bacterium]